MAAIIVFQDAAKAARGINSWSFTVDGTPALYWSPTEHAVQRVVSRLQLGRSGEAFGGAGIVSAGSVTTSALSHRKGRGKILAAGEVTTETVTMKSGRTKAREKRPGYLYELDGKPSPAFASESEARSGCAIAAFMTRASLGRFAEAEAHFKDEHGIACKVQVADLPDTKLHRKIVAKDERGGLWYVVFNAGMNRDKIKFTLVVPAAPAA